MLQLRAWLVDSSPEVWRRLVVDPRLTLEQLHTVLQYAFGWTDFQRLIELKANPPRRFARDYDDACELLERLGGWDPERFDLSEINEGLGRVRVKKAHAG